MLPLPWKSRLIIAHSPQTIQPHSDWVAVWLLTLLFAIILSHLHVSPSPPTQHPSPQYQGWLLFYNVLSLQDSFHYTDGINIGSHLLPWELNKWVPRMTVMASRTAVVGNVKWVWMIQETIVGIRVWLYTWSWLVFTRIAFIFFSFQIFITFKFDYVMYSY